MAWEIGFRDRRAQRRWFWNSREREIGGLLVIVVAAVEASLSLRLSRRVHLALFVGRANAPKALEWYRWWRLVSEIANGKLVYVWYCCQIPSINRIKEFWTKGRGRAAEGTAVVRQSRAEA